MKLLDVDSFEYRFVTLEREEQIAALLRKLKQYFKKDLKQP